MESKDVKKAVSDAEKELKEKQIDKVKEIVKATLERIEKLDNDIRELQSQRKILKLDIDDLKAGRLDRIEERQKKDPEASKTSVVKVKEKEIHHHHHYEPWYRPYVIEWNPVVQPYYVYTNSDCISFADTANAGSISFATNGTTSLEITGNLTHSNTCGTYVLADGKTVHLR